VLKLSKTIWLMFLLVIFIIIAIFFAYQWQEAEKRLAGEFGLNLSLKEQMSELQKEVGELEQELARQIEQKENLIMELDKLQNEIKEFKPEIRELKTSNPKETIHLPILMYHHIDYLSPNASKMWRDLTVSPERFEKQAKYLFDNHYQPITFREFIDYLNSGKSLSEKSLIITFDDGWKNQYQYAFPILKKYNFLATFFVVVNYIGGSSLMSWEELRELLDNGMEIGSHTMNHPNLRTLSEEKLRYEIQNSKIILEEKLGQKILVFAYPYGALDSKVIKAVKDSNYLAARSCIEGFDQNPENVYTLKTIQVYDNLYQLKKLFPPEE